MPFDAGTSMGDHRPMNRIRKICLIVILAAVAPSILGCGEKPTPTTGPDAPKPPGVPPGGP